MSHTYITTYTGKKFYPLEPTEEQIDIIDIAHALSNICRFTGHTRIFYSVAQHSCYAFDLASKENKLAALCHDFSESFLTDVSTPLKPLLTNYKQIEEKLEICLAKKFGYQYPYPSEVKNAEKNDIDTKLLFTELNQLMNCPNNKGYDFTIEYWPPERAEKELLQRFYSLTNKEI